MLKVAETVDLVTAFNASPNPYMILDAQFRYAGMNSAYLDATQSRREDLIGRNLFEVFDGAGSPGVEELRHSLNEVITTGEPHLMPLVHYPLTLIDASGKPAIQDRYWSATHTPIKDSEGRVTHILQHTQDVTESLNLRHLASALGTGDLVDAIHDIMGDGSYRRAATIQADNRRLARERTQLLEMFAQAPGFVAILTGPEHRLQRMNVACAELLGHRDIVGIPAREALPELATQGYHDAMDAVYATGEPFQGRQSPIMLSYPSRDVWETRYIDFMFQPLREPDGQISGVFVQGHDVTESVLAAQRQKLMIDELNHRVKNTLATVQSIAMQTARSHQDPSSFAETFQARILALSHTHDLLTQSLWEGAELRAVIEHEIAAYGSSRLSLNGPKVALDPATAVSMGMIFHELATNAAKYGALSSGGGRVFVDWCLANEGSRLDLTWIEDGGPPTAPPRRRGFGSRLIERNVRHDLAGKVETFYTSSGFKAEFSIPLSKDA